MKLAIHQLQYLPGLRFFAKMRAADRFIYLDDVQYEKREFQNRNKIRSKDGWQYLTAPVIVKGKFTQHIGEAALNPTYDWKTEHLKAIRLNYARAGYFREYFPALEKLYSGAYAGLGGLAAASIELLRNGFGITAPAQASSAFKLASASTQRLVDLCKAAGADEYLSGAGAKEYLDEKLFAENGIRLVWQEFRPLPYQQVFEGFVPDLSALDLLLNCGPDSVKYL